MASHQSFTRVKGIAKAIARCVFTPGRDSTKILDAIGLRRVINETGRGAAEDQRFMLHRPCTSFQAPFVGRG